MKQQVVHRDFIIKKFNLKKKNMLRQIEVHYNSEAEVELKLWIKKKLRHCGALWGQTAASYLSASLNTTRRHLIQLGAASY